MLLPVFVSLFLAVIIEGTQISVNDCPSSLARDDKLQVFSDKCYRFELNKTLDFESAQKKCQEDGGNLVMVKSKEENAFLRGEIGNTYKAYHVPFWIGLRFDAEDDYYYYVDGKQMGYDNLEVYNTYSPEDSRCVAIGYQYRYWQNYPCDKTMSSTFKGKNYICEYLTKPKYTVDDCYGSLAKKNLQVYEDKCYQFHVKSKLDQKSAQQVCQKDGGSLVMVKSSSIEMFLKSEIKSNYRKYQSYMFWIGLKYDFSKGKYEWEDGSSVVYENVHFNPSKQECVSVVGSNDQWYDSHCANKLRFICQYPIIPNLTVDNCPKNVPRNDRLKVFHGKCYSFETDQKLTFEDAESYCEKNGGKLAIIQHRTLNDFIYDELKQLTQSPTWIGMLYSETDRGYRWVDGSEANAFYFQLKEDFGLDGDHRCAVMNPSDGLWDFDKCNYRDALSFKEDSYLPFICQYNTSPFKFKPEESSASTTPTTTPTTTPSTTTISKQDCPVVQDDDNLIQVLGNKCYYFNIDSKLTYNHATQLCQTRGGQLVDAGATQVEDFLLNQMANTYKKYNDYFWIGNRSYKDQEACLALRPQSHEVWHKLDCSGKVQQTEYFVCEFDVYQNQATPIPTSFPSSTSGKEHCPIAVEDQDLIQVLNQTCYIFNITHSLNFNEAENYCESLGGHLTFIKTKEINDFLEYHLAISYRKEGLFWIGIHYNYTDHLYNWLDGTHLNYNNIRSGYGHDCVAFNTVDGKWDYDPCKGKIPTPSRLSYSERPFICEFHISEDTDGIDATHATMTPVNITSQPTVTNSTSLPTVTNTTSQPMVTNTTSPSTATNTSQTMATNTTSPLTVTNTTSQPKTSNTTSPPSETNTTSRSTATRTPTTSSQKPKPPTTKSSTKQPSTAKPPPTKPTQACKNIICELDCGLDGYKMNPVTSCPICECDN